MSSAPTATTGSAGLLGGVRRRIGGCGAGRKGVAVVLALGVAALGLPGCATGSSGGQAAPLTASADTCARMREAYGHFPDGATVTVATSFAGVEAERFDASMTVFTTCTGVEVVQEGSDALEAGLRADVATGRAQATPEARATGADPTAPDPAAVVGADLAVVPQPGLVGDLVDSRLISPLPNSVGANVEAGWDRLWMEAGSVNGTLYGAPIMASVKSFVWYSPSAFRAAGYEVPATWEELERLAARVVADHPGQEVTPWCLGLSDGATTGWTMTDWLEDSLLATRGTSAYDQWAGHEVPLSAPMAVQALDELESMVLADGRVAGGREGAAERTVDAAAQDLVAGSCLMMHASSSFETHLPPGTLVTDGSSDPQDQATVPGAVASAPAEATDPAEPAASPVSDISAFLLPSVDEGDSAEKPILAGGDYLVALNVSEASTAVMTYLTSAEWAQERVLMGGVASANRGADVSSVSSPVARLASEILQSRQSVIRLDASDTMPSQVGTEALWVALTAWTRGELDSRQALEQADQAWPQPQR